MTRLISAGLSRDDAHLQTPPDSYLPAEAEDAGGAAQQSLAGRLRSLGHWLAGPAVPGAAGTYRDAIRRGSTVVVVHVADEAAAERASLLMAAAGAFDIELRISRWR